MDGQRERQDRTKAASQGLVPAGVGYLAGLNYFSMRSLCDVCCWRDGDAFHAEEYCRLFRRHRSGRGSVRPEQRISNVYKMYRSSRVHPSQRGIQGGLGQSTVRQSRGALELKQSRVDEIR